ncbi:MULTISPECIES: sensor histidine kinase [Cryobacterium]|uniref:histidine kinase n=1 Tax=Cryobacterium glucosi TaxID=1259175 RepID=A0ABY2INI3_9MICO|nr:MULTISPECIES: histidine kinase [Cryobacterium]TFB98802.1 two-component sensor histidine kinase [Cryobacterium sp. MDB2-A-1]TFC04282.1 two-component sensor histidine kinase [Cryobacterium sp. MDB2-33-2]TFC14948.1 two-component sensor histidine kinase [Cryobacterium sp. MDB2-A-2]TFC16454.1 two-component sensor histidine kinase [Cryobacterium sp. MDB2-10]TFC21181.1 two-component sensor histidine kinase [Cryobacterium glucosi]
MTSMYSHAHIPRWAADVLVSLAVLGSAFVPAGEYARVASNPAGVLIAVAATLVLLPRRRWPLPVLAACVALFVLAGALGVLNPAFSLATAIAVWNVAIRTDRRTTLVATALAAFVLVGTGIAVTATELLDARIVQYAAVIAFAGAAGDAMRSRREYIVAITERARNAEETRESEALRRVAEDRLRIARELHDAVAHQMAVINLHAGVAAQALPDRPTDAQDSLTTIRQAAQAVLREIGTLLAVLRDDSAGRPRPPAAEIGLGRVDALLADFARDGLAVTVSARGAGTRLPAPVDTIAYRIVQEALTNAHKHGAGHTAELRISYGSDSVDIEALNPVAFHVFDPATDAPAGHGLVGVAERAGTIGGTVEFGVRPPDTFRLAVSLPISSAGTDAPADIPDTGPPAPARISAPTSVPDPAAGAPS